MAIIQSGATADLWTIDPTSKAGRVTIYNSAGLELGGASNPYIVKIQSGATVDQLTIDPASKALRSTLYDLGAKQIFRPITAAYLLPIKIRQTATTAAGETVWAMRYVSGSLIVHIRRISGVITFDGTASPAKTVGYRFRRFSAATMSGGTTITVAKKRSSYPDSVVTDARFSDTGLTTTGVTFDAIFSELLIPISVSSMILPFSVDFDKIGIRLSDFELSAGEGLAIQLSEAAEVGLGIFGWVEWDEE